MCVVTSAATVTCGCAGAAPLPRAEEELSDHHIDLSSTDHLTDLTTPASWYPAARMLRRRVVAHMGPTNSGKTHAALQALKAAGTGVYCGPLRLLAWEASFRHALASVLLACWIPPHPERSPVHRASMGTLRALRLRAWHASFFVAFFACLLFATASN